MRVLICGGRNYKDLEGGALQVCEALATVPLNPPEKSDVVFISGCARGADQIPISMVEDDKDWGGIELFPADWNKYGKSAGYVRNSQMLKEGKPDLVIAFEGGRGTDMMVNLARKAGVEVWQFYDRPNTISARKY